MDNLLWFILVGLVAGWLTGLLVKGEGYGIVGDIVLGVIGAVIGGWIFSLLGITAYGTLGAIVMAVIGAVLFVGLVRLVRRT
jgi:uncharacterized membrane protein YeaQ/YmgE (transglycosylase-associated protein family)